MTLKAINPATEAVIAEYPAQSDAEIEKRLTAARAAAATWRAIDPDQRATRLRRLAALLREQSAALSELMTREMGKPIASAEAEVSKSAACCDYFADNAAMMLAPQHRAVQADESYVRFDPLGVVLAIMPWNFPLWQFFRFAAPALMAGNGVLLKHASNVPGCASDIRDLLAEAGLPEGLAAVLFLDTDAVGELIEDRHLHAVTLTGSVGAGRAVAARAGAALKKTVMELGGSDASVVLSDADLDFAAAESVRSRLINNGQSCIAAKRFVVVDALHDAFVERVAAEMSKVVMGPPLDEATTLGPMARVELRDELHDQVEASVAQGARLRMGGVVPDRPGAWYPATLLTEVGPGMPAYTDELFGPVAAVIRARDDDDALRIANDTDFGLGGAIYTRDLERGERLAADHLNVGAAFVNGLVRSDPRLPFGGIGISGYGRELSPLGIREFVNVKTVWVDRPGG